MASREGEVRSCTAVLSVEHVSLVCENEFGVCRRSLQEKYCAVPVPTEAWRAFNARIDWALC